MKRWMLLFFAPLAYAQSLESLLEALPKQNLSLVQGRDAIMIEDTQLDVSDSWENPYLTVGANDLLVDDILARDKEPMQTQYVTLSQKIPIGGKKSLQKSIALVDRELAHLAYHDKLLSLQSRVSRLGYRVAIIDEKRALIEAYQKSVQKLKRLHTKRYEVGKSSLSAIEKTKILSKKLRIKADKLTTMKQRFLYQLEQLTYQDVSSVEVALVMDKKIQTDIRLHPRLKMADLKTQKAKESLKLKRAQTTPDMKLGLGYFQREDRGDYLSVNIGMALPIWGKEQSGVDVALLKQNQAKSSLKSLTFTMQKEVENLRSLMADSMQSYTIIKEEILPKQRFIHKLLNREIFTKDSSTQLLYENLNEMILLEFEAFDEMESYFDAYAELLYFKGEIS
jgi:outer membrane protein TolC